MTNYHIKNIQIIDAQQNNRGDVFIENGKFVTQKNENLSYEGLDGDGKILFPGCFDPHVHFRDPGFTEKEDFKSGSMAAISGGVTTVFDMPNTNPPVFTVENLNKKREIAHTKSMCHYGLFFGAGIGNLEEIKNATNIPGIKLYLNTTTGNLKMDDENSWREIFHLGKKVALHAEGKTFFRAIEVWKEEGSPCEIHLCHSSLKSEIDLIREIKKDPQIKNKISVEVCPHHLFLTHAEREKYGAICCMKPELATQKDLDALWAGVEDGTIDFFATDHAPHTKAEKDKSNEPNQAPVYGIGGVETFFPLLLTEFLKRKYSLQKLAAMTSYNTANVYHLKDKKGQIKTGYDADCLIIDLEQKTTVQATKFWSKAKWSPFENWPITGKIETVFLAGEKVFSNGKFIEENSRGQEIVF